MFMIATHDESIIRIAINSEKRYHKRILFGMLKGVRSSFAAKLAGAENMNIYLPYGEEWMKYSMRRLSEWEHTKIIIRSIIQG
jgi:Proline dehydrogenase.